MKETIIIIIILIIIFGGAYYTQKFLNDSSDYLVSQLESLKTGINEKNITEEEMQQISDEIYGEWIKTNKKWSIIILHDELDLIETSLIKMKSKITTGNINESIEDLDTSIFLLNHIKEKEKTSLKNIF